MVSFILWYFEIFGDLGVEFQKILIFFKCIKFADLSYKIKIQIASQFDETSEIHHRGQKMNTSFKKEELVLFKHEPMKAVKSQNTSRRKK